MERVGVRVSVSNKALILVNESFISTQQIYYLLQDGMIHNIPDFVVFMVSHKV
jgi:hypothetical protein